MIWRASQRGEGATRSLHPRAERGARTRTRRTRRGMTLMEVMVTMALLVLIFAVLAPGVGNVLGLEQRDAARKLAQTFELLHDEAVLRNRTYRVVFDLAANKWEVEESEEGGLIFSSPELREEWMEKIAERLDDMDEEERAEFDKERKFQKAAGEISASVELPEGLFIKSIYTAQYREPVTLDENAEGENANRVGVHLFSSGYAEFAVIQLAERDNEDAGYTIQLDPLSGKVRLHSELLEYDDLLDFIPDEPPTLRN